MRQANDIARMNGMKKEEFKAAKQEILEKKQVVSDQTEQEQRALKKEKDQMQKMRSAQDYVEKTNGQYDQYRVQLEKQLQSELDNQEKQLEQIDKRR